MLFQLFHVFLHLLWVLFMFLTYSELVFTFSCFSNDRSCFHIYYQFWVVFSVFLWVLSLFSHLFWVHVSHLFWVHVLTFLTCSELVFMFSSRLDVCKSWDLSSPFWFVKALILSWNKILDNVNIYVKIFKIQLHIIYNFHHLELCFHEIANINNFSYIFNIIVNCWNVS